MATERTVERRKNRKELSEEDERYLGYIRGLFDRDGARRITSGELKAMLRVGDGYVASRVFSLLGGDGRRSLDKNETLGKIVSLILGEEEAKLRFLFDLHDQNGDGFIGRPELKRMLDASLRQNEIAISTKEKADLVQAIFKKAAGTGRRIDFTSFKRLLRAYPEVQAETIRSVTAWFTGEDGLPAERGRLHFGAVVRFLFTTVPSFVYKWLLLALYVALNGYLFWITAERFAAGGANIYLQIAHGAAACINLNGALILVPMMRSLLGRIRRTPFARIVPADHHIEIHKLLGEVMFGFALLHTAAHLMNYETSRMDIVQQLFHTYIGLTGVILLGIFVLIWIFARKGIRRGKGFEVFYLSHLLYVGWFAFMLIHAKSFWLWGIWSLAGFAIELIVKRFVKRHISFVEKAAPLPGGTIELRFHRPAGFTFQPGDYIYLRIPRVSRMETHPFTISSNPEEKEYLSVHIRTLGNWTKAVSRLFTDELSGSERRIPVMFVGPYGTPSNRIFKAKHAILIGAGIGVTPFASILRSILHRRLAKEPMKLERVHFFWLNRGQRSFEWFADLLSDLEARKLRDLFDINIYMTNAEVNAASGLVKIGMELIQRQTKRDVTTGLRSVTHFGRPNWGKLFEELSREHGARSVAVFFCGAYPLAVAVHRAARRYGFAFRKENF